MSNSGDNDDDGLSSASVTTHGFFHTISRFTDAHIREIKYGVYGLGLIGGLLVLRSVHATKIFEHVEDIPERFFTRAIRLQGKIHNVDSQGILHTKHIPIINIRRWTSFTDTTALLPIKIACVDITTEGQVWLKGLEKKVVWFRLFNKECHPEQSIECTVYLSKIFSETCINEELVRRGLCSVTDYSNLSLPKNPEQIKVLEKLYKLQSKADKKGIGIWKVTTEDKTLRLHFLNVLKWIGRFPILLLERFKGKRKINH
ncbi:hypothetical protein ScPMuIL_007694 [Solemya velum]